MKRLPKPFALLLLMGSLFFPFNQTYAQITCPTGLTQVGLLDISTCNRTRDIKCTSKDLSIVGVFLGDGACISCTAGSTISLPLKFRINNSTGSIRTAFAVFGTLVITRGTETKTCDFKRCVGPIPPNQTTTIDFGNVDYTCGDTWKLTKIVLAWTDASSNSTCGAITCANIAPKCGTPEDVTIATPLGCRILNSTLCSGPTNGSITAAASGGVPPYTFTLNPGNKKNTTGAFTGLVPGTYNITINDSDTRQSGGCTTTCGPVTINSNPAVPLTAFKPPLTCTDATYSVQVNPPLVVGTYSLTQPTGGVTPPPIIYNGTGSVIFTGLTIGKGYRVSVSTSSACLSDPDVCPPIAPAPRSSNLESPKAEPMKEKATVVAAPNPFNDKVQFTINSPISGQGTLELYNMLGQSVKIIYRGNVDKGMEQTFEYNVPSDQRANLIYIFKVGDQKISGKLISFK